MEIINVEWRLLHARHSPIVSEQITEYASIHCLFCSHSSSIEVRQITPLRFCSCSMCGYMTGVISIDRTSFPGYQKTRVCWAPSEFIGMLGDESAWFGVSGSLASFPLVEIEEEMAMAADACRVTCMEIDSARQAHFTAMDKRPIVPIASIGAATLCLLEMHNYKTAGDLARHSESLNEVPSIGPAKIAVLKRWAWPRRSAGERRTATALEQAILQRYRQEGRHRFIAATLSDRLDTEKRRAAMKISGENRWLSELRLKGGTDGDWEKAWEISQRRRWQGRRGQGKGPGS